MKANGALGKLYDRLTPEERFRLDVEATARGDDKESKKLVDTCPRKSYTATDWGFSGRWQAATELTLAVCVDLCQHLARIRMLEALKETLPYVHTCYHNEAHTAYLEGHEAGSRYAWKMAGREGEPPGWEPLGEDEEVEDDSASDPQIDKDLDTLEERMEEADITPTLLERLERHTSIEALAVWEGYARFCLEELDLAPQKLLKVVFEPAFDTVKKLRALQEKHSIESSELEEKAEELLAVVCEHWSIKRREFERLS